MKRGRLEAFSDGVLAIAITIMVLELKVPHGHEWADLRGMGRQFLGYVLSFVYLAIYWNNHHHLLHTVERIDGRIMWANMHLLFWLSLVPVTTAWLGESGSAAAPTATYGAVLLCAAIAYTVLQTQIVRLHGPDSALARAVGRDRKGKASMVAYVVSIPLALWVPWVSYGLFVLVALVWLVPDRRISRNLVA